jgi:UDP-N-acetylglucosamine acyltransferase
MLMVGAHVAHDCVVGNDVVFANNATIGGFVEIGDHVFLGGLCAVQQFARIGEQAIIGGLAGVANDVIPYAAVVGHRAKLAGLNRVGLRRRGLSNAEIQNIYKAYRSIFFGAGTFGERVARTADASRDDVRVMRMIDFIRSGKRRLTLPRNNNDESD